MVVQLVRNPRGGGKRQLDKTLECELIRKKKRHLYIVCHQSRHQLCFAMSLARLLNPELNDEEALERGRELQCLADLNDQTMVTLGDVCKFEEILKRKIVVYCRKSEDRALYPFAIAYPRHSEPLFLLLFQGHYYGIKNVKGLLGAKTSVPIATEATKT